MVDYRKGRDEEELEPFFPNEILRHTILTFFLISAVMVAVIVLPESFQKSTDEFASFQSRPPWYLLPFYQLSSLVESKVLCITALVIFALLFISIPFLDKKSERRLWKKPFSLSIIVMSLLMIIASGLMKYLQYYD